MFGVLIRCSTLSFEKVILSKLFAIFIYTFYLMDVFNGWSLLQSKKEISY